MDYSVIIPTHNRPGFVIRAIESVFAQTCLPLEVIVVDDASQPPLSLPKRLGNGRVRVIRHERSLGGAAARNTGLHEARGDVVAFLDDDDEWLPTKMETQIAWLGANPDADLVTCGHYRLEGGRQYREVFTQDFVERYCQHDNFFGSFSFIAVRRSRLRLDPDLPAMQDWDFALRATRRAFFGVIEEPLVKYYAHDLPRITNGRGNHLRGLRHCYLKHRTDLSADARRWLLGRVIFERSRSIVSRSVRAGRVFDAILLAARCRVPLSMKLRTIGRRAASLGLSARAVAAIRTAAITGWQGLGEVFGRVLPPEALEPARKIVSRTP